MEASSSAAPRGLHASVFCIALALLVDEILLASILHVLIGEGHTASALALALIGLAAGGIIAYVVPALQDGTRALARHAQCTSAFAIGLLAMTPLLMSVPLNYVDLVYRGGALAVQAWRAVVLLAAVVPFVLGGAALAVAFRHFAADVGRLYAADLAGAAAGCLAAPWLLTTLGAPRGIMAAALPALLVGTVAIAGPRRRRAAFALLGTTALGLTLMRPDMVSFRTLNTLGRVDRPSYRSFPIGPGDIDFERWALDAWTIIRSDRIPQQWEDFAGWGLSSRYRGKLPRVKLVNFNARFSTYVTAFDGDLDVLGPWLDADLVSLHHRLGRTYARVLNVGAGGGREVLAALYHGATRVVAVDVSAVVVDDVMQRYLRRFSGDLYRHPRVEAHATEGRSFVERTPERFDLIDFSVVGGMNVEKMDLVRVEDLFTREALATYLDRLAEGGTFSYVMYSQRTDLVDRAAAQPPSVVPPYVPAVKTLTGLRLAFERRWPGRHFADHVLIAALPGRLDPRSDLVHLMVSERAYSASERTRFLDVCRTLAFEALHPSPGPPPSKTYADLVTTSDLTAFAAGLGFSPWPATDDRPFAFAFDAAHLLRAPDWRTRAGMLFATPIARAGSVVGVLGLLVVGLPLALAGRGMRVAEMGRIPLARLAAFAGLGYGYMAVEVATILKLQLYLGQPIYALSLGLGTFLASTALGSRASDALPGRAARRLAGASLVVVVLGLGLFAFAGPVLVATLGLPLPARAGLAVLLLAPLGFAMGMPFPSAVRLLAGRDASFVPWAWAINGCFSVVGIFGTRAAALFVGFDRALLVGLAAYGLVLVLALRQDRAGR